MEVNPRLLAAATADAERQPPRQPDNTTDAKYPDPATRLAQRESGSGAGVSTGHYTPSHPQSRTQTLYTASPPPDPLYDLKRPRACQACRQLKVRCEPDASHPSGPCRRCAKAGRNCVVTLPTRKRQKKADTRVAELERKVDALSASLQAQRQGQGQEVSQRQERSFDRGSLAGLAAVAGAEGKEGVGQQEQNTGQQSGRRWLGSLNGSGLVGSKRRSSGEVKMSSEPMNSPKQDPWHRERQKEPYDILDKGTIDVGTANAAFERYVNDMAPLMPFVVFPPGTEMEEIRRSKPILLHAIIAVAIGSIQPSAQVALLQDFYKLIAERAVVNGEKSLELVQATLVSVNWYIPPDHFEELKFYHLIHLAVIMGMDIGMNRRITRNRISFNLIGDLIGKKPSALNQDAPEMRRAWLGCYFGSVQASTALRRSFLVRWQPYMDECLEILENSPDALPSDKTVIQLVKLAHLSEEVGIQFWAEGPGSSVSFSDPKVQYSLKALEQQLLQWRKDISPESYSVIMRQTEHILNIYMHEAAMHVDANSGLASAEDGPGLAHINALTTCLTSVEQALDAVCSMDLKTFLSVPSMVLARTSYAAVTLIRLYSLASAPDSKIGQVIDPANLRVEHQLDRVLRHYNVAGEQAGARAHARFAVVLSLLRDWFVKRKDQNPALREALGGPGQPVSCGEEIYKGSEDSQKITTPLHLLSEVAMGDPNRPLTQTESQYPARGYSEPSSDVPSSVPSNTGTNSEWMQQYPAAAGSSSASQQRQLYRMAQYPDMSTATAGPYSDAAGTGPFLPNAGLEQAYFVPEWGMQMGFYPESLFALGNMLDEGFF